MIKFDKIIVELANLISKIKIILFISIVKFNILLKIIVSYIVLLKTSFLLLFTDIVNLVAFFNNFINQIIWFNYFHFFLYNHINLLFHFYILQFSSILLNSFCQINIILLISNYNISCFQNFIILYWYKTSFVFHCNTFEIRINTLSIQFS